MTQTLGRHRTAWMRILRAVVRLLVSSLAPRATASCAAAVSGDPRTNRRRGAAGCAPRRGGEGGGAGGGGMEGEGARARGPCRQGWVIVFVASYFSSTGVYERTLSKAPLLARLRSRSFSASLRKRARRAQPP
jgi:hypothetical protein